MVDVHMGTRAHNSGKGGGMKRFMFVAKKQDEDGYGTTITDEISSMVGIKGWFEKGTAKKTSNLLNGQEALRSEIITIIGKASQ